jgi:hypothetical protein
MHTGLQTIYLQTLAERDGVNHQSSSYNIPNPMRIWFSPTVSQMFPQMANRVTEVLKVFLLPGIEIHEKTFRDFLGELKADQMMYT